MVEKLDDLISNSIFEWRKNGSVSRTDFRVYIRKRIKEMAESTNFFEEFDVIKAAWEESANCKEITIENVHKSKGAHEVHANDKESLTTPEVSNDHLHEQVGALDGIDELIGFAIDSDEEPLSISDDEEREDVEGFFNPSDHLVAPDSSDSEDDIESKVLPLGIRLGLTVRNEEERQREIRLLKATNKPERKAKGKRITKKLGDSSASSSSTRF